MAEKIKYQRSLHWPTSPGATNDDRIHTSISQWEGMEVVATEKYDGECTGIARDYIHARSLDYNPHPSRIFMKSLWAKISYNIPESFRIYGENITAVHSIEYFDLESYFYVFNIWDGLKCLSWDDTVEYATLLGLPTVPVLYRGMWFAGLVEQLSGSLDLNRQEGFVVRPAASFQFDEFSTLLFKWVRPNHVRSDSEHWMRQPVRFNKLKNG